MKKFALISMLIIVLQSGLHAGDDFKAQSRSQITEFLKHYQPSGPQNPLRTFDAWIEKIMRADDTQWVPLAKELLDNLKMVITRNNCLANYLELLSPPIRLSGYFCPRV